MGHTELDEHDIPLNLAARALRVPPRTLLDWLSKGEIKGDQTLSDRWWVKVGECRKFIREKRGENSRAEEVFDAVLLARDLPPSPFKLPEVEDRHRGMMLVKS